MPLKHSVEEVILKNGARGLLIDVPDVTVMSYEFSFRAGNNYMRRPDVQQTAHILEHMAFNATKLYPSGELFSQEFAKNAAYNNATTWDTNLDYYGNCADMEWSRILDLQRLSITEPLFLPSALKTEKQNVREELFGYESKHDRMVWLRVGKAMGSMLFLDSEKAATIDNVTLDDIKEHYHRTHTLRNMRFVITGVIANRRQAIIDQLESWQLPTGSRLAVIPEKLHKAELVYLHRSDMANTRFGLSIALNRQLNQKELLAMSTLNHILTGTFHSRIFGKARTAGICYSMGSGVSNDIAGTCDWYFGGQVSIENGQALFDLIVEQLKKVAEGDITDEDLAEASQFAIGSLQKSGQTVGALSDLYGSDYFYNESINLLEDEPERIMAVDLPTIQLLVDEFFEAAIWGFGGIGNITKKQLQVHYDQLAKLF